VPTGTSWLRRDLLLRLMVPLVLIFSAVVALGAFSAHRLVERVFDHWLLDAAASVAALVRVDQGRATLDLPPQAEALLLYDDIDQTWFAASQGERLIGGRSGLAGAGDREAAYPRGRAFYAALGSMPVRIARVDVAAGGGPVTVLVAETLRKRKAAEQDLLWMLLPMGLLVAAAALSVGWAVHLTVRPLETIAARWRDRSHVSLEAIDVAGVPRELMPFASALNDLLARIRTMLARERQFAATAAHQIRTPLSGLQLGLARAREATEIGAMRGILDEVGAGTQRTARLVQQLLLFGRLDPETRRDITFLDGDLVALAADVGALHVDQALAKDIDLELAAPERPVIVPMQRDLLAEALSNLFDNAIRYTPAGGRVLVEFGIDPPALRICDSGPGIAPDERALVLERFVRGRNAGGDGSGLGLAIVRDIAVLHDAQLVLGESDWGGAKVELRFRRSGD
jgi:two-component system sensor histidine kinase TctE